MFLQFCTLIHEIELNHIQNLDVRLEKLLLISYECFSILNVLNLYILHLNLF
jgi:hypothetical protein